MNAKAIDSACMNADDICDEEYIHAQRLYRAMHAPLDEREEPMPSPEQAMHWTKLSLYWVAACAAAGLIAWAVYASWPLFLAAVK